MLPVRGLQPGEITFDRVFLPCKRGIYFSAVALSVWDNIHGPKILSLWTGRPSPTESETESAGTGGTPSPSTETLLAVVNYSLNDEAGRIDKLDGVEAKFYCLQKYDIIASAFIFSVELSRGKPDVFSFLLTLPYSEMPAYLARHRFCEVKVQRMLEDYLIVPLKAMMGKGSMKDKVLKVIPRLTKPLEQFTQLMYSVRHHSLPEKIDIAQTFLGRDLERRTDIKSFLQHAIMSHLQSSGYSVVVGEDEGVVNKMLCTLGLFLSARERKMSRLAARYHADWALVTTQSTESPEGGEAEPGYLECFSYEPDLFLQGYVVSGGESYLPFSRADLWQNRLPSTVIHMDIREVRVVDSPAKVPVFIRRKEDLETTKTKKTNEQLPLKELTVYEAKEFASRIVMDFLEHLRLLPVVGGAREAYIVQFIRLVKLKALALVKYVDAEPKSGIQQVQEQVVNALTLRGAAADRPKVNLVSLQQDLSIESMGDLYLVLAFAEKIRSNSYLDVLGDPQLQAEAVLKEFETF